MNICSSVSSFPANRARVDVNRLSQWLMKVPKASPQLVLLSSLFSNMRRRHGTQSVSRIRIRSYRAKTGRDLKKNCSPTAFFFFFFFSAKGPHEHTHHPQVLAKHVEVDWRQV